MLRVSKYFGFVNQNILHATFLFFALYCESEFRLETPSKMNGIMKWLHVFSVLVLFDQIYNQPHYYVPNSDYENIDNTDGITPSPSAKLDEDQ